MVAISKGESSTKQVKDKTLHHNLNWILLQTNSPKHKGKVIDLLTEQCRNMMLEIKHITAGLPPQAIGSCLQKWAAWLDTKRPVYSLYPYPYATIYMKNPSRQRPYTTGRV